MPSLLHVTDDEPGIARRGRTNFRYVRQTTGREVRDPKVLERIRRLAIPPAWTDVWICADPRGHVQATGRDARGRKQYRYHPDFRQRRERHKFNQLVEFGAALDTIRNTVDQDLGRRMLDRERVLAAVIWLMELTYVRIGNEAYARDNKSFGLTTLRCNHVDVDGARLRLRFTAKAGKRADVSCCDARLARVVRRCQELPGQLLFQYVGDDDVPCRVTSTDVNDYLRAVSGFDVTAKTFRTWGASLLAAQELVLVPPPSSEREAAIAVKAALTPVATRLGNTVTVCRNSYVHPTVISSYEKGTLPDAWAAGPSRAKGRLSADERRLLALLAA